MNSIPKINYVLAIRIPAWKIHHKCISIIGENITINQLYQIPNNNLVSTQTKIDTSLATAYNQITQNHNSMLITPAAKLYPIKNSPNNQSTNPHHITFMAVNS
jgi:hypothetical protein